MSINVSEAFVQSYSNVWLEEYQGAQAITDAMVRAEVAKGKTHEFKVYGDTEFVEHVGTDPLSLDNPEVRVVTATLRKYSRRIYENNIDSMMLNVPERNASARSLAMAGGRRSDQLKIDALVTSGSTNIIAHGNDPLTLDKIFEAGEELDKVGAPEGAMNRFFFISERQNRDLLGISEIKNVDTSGVRSGVTARPTTYGGFTFVIINSGRREGGLPVASNVRQCFATHREALGVAMMPVEPVKIERVPQNDSWQVAGFMVQGAVALKPEGIVSVQCQET